MECLGCRIANGIEPGLNIIFENEYVTCVLDIAPFNEGHTLCADGGQFNDLTHYHMHMVPRYEGDGLAWNEPLLPDGAEHRLSETRAKLLAALNVK